MKFDFRRLTPALVTSLALIFFALLCASIGWTVFAWLVGLLGLALNVVGIAVVQIDDAAASSSAVAERNRGKVGGKQPAAVSASGHAEAAPAQGPVKSNPFADKAKNARAALRNSASRGGRSSQGSASTAAGGKDSGASRPVDSAATDPTDSDQSGDSVKVSDSPKITKRL
ncbi:MULTISPECIES: hypothetical protein [Kocuria]|uniref:Uncharacterized protein n=1 Tax=Kocuria subflava TaxID=1736139 RepID=A0A846TTH2_9MICC|nr:MULTISPECIES: hypothetical protein [Kocuria]NKE10290.1 hypothetical protein [Kocuria subflava]